MNEHPTRQKILAHLEAHPDATFQEMMEVVGVKSKAVVDYHITKLVSAGLVKRQPPYQVVKRRNKEAGNGSDK